MKFGKQTETDTRAETIATLSNLVQSATEPAPKPTPAAAAAANGPARREEQALLGRGSRVSGKISFEGPVWIDGQIEGEIAAKDSLTISESATVTAQIRAASVTVAGKVTGDIIASKRIEIRPSANVRGNLVSPALIVHEGAVFDGRCSMRSEGAREDRKTGALPKEQPASQDGADRERNAAAPSV